MGDEDDAEARRKRAADLREQIAREAAGQPDKPSGPEPGAPPSPREFVQRRMRELDRGKKNADDPPGS